MCHCIEFNTIIECYSSLFKKGDMKLKIFMRTNIIVTVEVKRIKPAFSDERGSIWDYLTDETIHHVGFLISNKGAIRGKHYHKEQKQYTLVQSGKIQVTTKNLLDKNSKIEKNLLEEMDMILFPPYCYHSIESIEDSTCLIFTSKSRKGTGYEDDTYRIKDIDTFEFKQN